MSIISHPYWHGKYQVGDHVCMYVCGYIDNLKKTGRLNYPWSAGGALTPPPDIMRADSTHTVIAATI